MLAVMQIVSENIRQFSMFIEATVFFLVDPVPVCMFRIGYTSSKDVHSSLKGDTYVMTCCNHK